MRYIFKPLAVSLLAIFFVAGCNKDEKRVIFEGGENPVLTASSLGPFILDQDEANSFGIRFDWTNPDYRFNTGVSSQDVTYTLQVDMAGGNFSSAKLIETVIPNELGITYTVKAFNSFFSRMELDFGIAYDVQFRIKASLVNGSVPVYSNVLNMTVTPYLDFVVEPPGTEAAGYLDGELWATGNAFASDWSNPLPPPYDVDQKFTRIDILHYEATLNFNATGGYKLIQQQGNWDTQYHALAPNEALSGDFEKRNDDPQFLSPGPGLYKVEINFQTGKYKLTKL